MAEITDKRSIIQLAESCNTDKGDGMLFFHHDATEDKITIKSCGDIRKIEIALIRLIVDTPGAMSVANKFFVERMMKDEKKAKQGLNALKKLRTEKTEEKDEVVTQENDK